MRRREAVRLFREISECIPDAFISSISLIKNSRLKEEFDLQITVSLNPKNMQNLQTLIGKHGMQLKEEKGSLIIYGTTPNRLKLQIIA
jgi:hypothetical protein